MLKQIISTGGDTDTNASIAGQIAGTLIGTENIPYELILKLRKLPDYKWIKQVIDATKQRIS